MLTWDDLFELDMLITFRRISLEDSKRILGHYPDMVEMYDRDLAKLEALEKKVQKAKFEALYEEA
jgi:hypothetical protein